MALDSPEDDLSLVRSAVKGRLEAFDALVLRHQDRLYGIIHRLVGDPEKAMDLAQESFLRAWRGLSGFQGDSSFFTWLYRIARNVITSAARHDAARPRFTASLQSEGGDGEATQLDPASSAPAPEEHTLSDEQRSLVTAAIAALPPDFREIVVLRDIDDRSYEEIADLLDIPVGTVRSRLHRARMDLKERLRQSLDPTA